MLNTHFTVNLFWGLPFFMRFYPIKLLVNTLNLGLLIPWLVEQQFMSQIFKRINIIEIRNSTYKYYLHTQ